METLFSPFAPAPLPCTTEPSESFMNPNPRAMGEGAGSSALSAKVQKRDEACVLVSEQFHVEFLRVRVCCVLDL